jgi:type VII secretion protein EccE
MTAARGEDPADRAAAGAQPGEHATGQAPGIGAAEDGAEGLGLPATSGQQRVARQSQSRPVVARTFGEAATAAAAPARSAGTRPPPTTRPVRDARAEGTGSANTGGFARSRRWLQAQWSRRTGRTVGLGQLLCWQLAAVGVIASIGQRRQVVAVAVAVATAVVVTTTVRINGLWLYQWLFRGARFMLRARRRAVAAGNESADHLVDMVAQHTVVETIDLDGVPVALIHQPAGVTAVLEPHTPGGPHDAGLTLAELNLSSPASLLPPQDADSPPYAAQMIMQVSQAPDPQAPFAGSFGLHRGTQRRRTWITLQALRSAEVYLDDDLTASLANAVRRLIRRLARDELPIRTLDRDEALSLVLGLSLLDDAVSGPDPVALNETWGAWEAGPTTQACFRLDGWQGAGEAARQLILRRLHQVPSLATTVAIAARRGERRGELQVDVVVRLAETSRALLDNSAGLLAFAIDAASVQQETGIALGSDIRLERLNGDHLAAVAASLPFGGFDSAR